MAAGPGPGRWRLGVAAVAPGGTGREWGLRLVSDTLRAKAKYPQFDTRQRVFYFFNYFAECRHIYHLEKPFLIVFFAECHPTGHSAKDFYFLYFFAECHLKALGKDFFWPPNYFLFSLHIILICMVNIGIFLDIFGIYL